MISYETRMYKFSNSSSSSNVVYVVYKSFTSYAYLSSISFVIQMWVKDQMYWN
jgi:hypothetical protein